MRLLLARPKTVALILFGLVGLLAAVELVAGQRSAADIAVLTALAVLTTGIYLLLRIVTDELGDSLASRQELHARLGQQQAVARLGQLALTDISRHDLLAEAVRVVAAELRTELAGVLELLPDGSAFVLAAGFGWPAEQIGNQEVPAGPRSQGGYTLASNRPVIMSDAALETRFDLSPHMVAEGITSGVSASIGANGGTYGVLGAHTYARRDFADDDVTFLESVANVLASALRRRAAEGEAEQTHRVLEAVIEGTDDDVFVKDLDGRFIEANANALRTLGQSREHLIGRLMHEVMPRDQADAMAVSDRVIKERGTVETFEETISLGGVTRTVLTTKGPYRARDGTLLGTFGIAHDITARNAQEQELARSEERLRLAQQGAGMGTWDVDLANGVTTWSEGLRNLYGVAADHPAGFAHFAELVHPEDREWVTGVVQDGYATGTPLEFECRVVRPDGRLVWIMTRSSSIRDDDGALVRVLGMAVDVTKRKLAEEELGRSEGERAQLEERLRQAEKLEAVGRLAGGVAHDFNNLLVAIKGYGELALAQIERDREVAADYIGSVLGAADRAALLTKQLLAFGRRQVLIPEVLDLNEVVEETSSLLQRVIGDGVRLVTHLADRPVVVRADRGQLEQVITNLAVNGRDAMDGAGVLTIRVMIDGAHSLLTVTDEGSGIDTEVAQHIFEPFFTTKGEHGTGLGLATVHGIVAQSGGQLVLESEVGRGSTFKVTLPLCAEAVSERPSAPSGSGGGLETILLVEDDPAVRSLVATMLAARGYTVLDAAGGEQAIALVEERDGPIELVLSDLLMHGLDGRQTAGRIRELEPTVKVLYMSGYTDDATIRGGDLEPGTGYIQKPFSGDELAGRIRKLLESAT